MAKYEVAHIRHQGHDIIIIPVDGQFEYKNNQQQNTFRNAMQAASLSAGLAGEVAVVWLVGNRMKFLAPHRWHRYVASLPWHFIAANLNRTIHI